MKCECPNNCRYCGRRRSKDSVGHYCKTKNCQWEFAYSTCQYKIKVDTKGKRWTSSVFNVLTLPKDTTQVDYGELEARLLALQIQKGKK